MQIFKRKSGHCNVLPSPFSHRSDSYPGTSGRIPRRCVEPRSHPVPGHVHQPRLLRRESRRNCTLRPHGSQVGCTSDWWPVSRAIQSALTVANSTGPNPGIVAVPTTNSHSPTLRTLLTLTPPRHGQCLNFQSRLTPVSVRCPVKLHTQVRPVVTI